MAKQNPEEALKYLLRMGNLAGSTIMKVMDDLKIDRRTVQRLIQEGLEKGTYYLDRNMAIGLIEESTYKIPTIFDVGYSIVVKGELVDPSLLKLFEVKDRDKVLSMLFHNMRMDDCLVRVTANYDTGREYTLEGYIRRNSTDRVNIYQENPMRGSNSNPEIYYSRIQRVECIGATEHGSAIGISDWNQWYDESGKYRNVEK